MTYIKSISVSKTIKNASKQLKFNSTHKNNQLLPLIFSKER